MSAEDGADPVSALTDSEVRKARTRNNTSLVAAKPNQLQVIPKGSQHATISEFTSWKLTTLNYLASDPRLRPADKLAAFGIMRHVNWRTRIACVSIETVSDEVCIRRRHVLQAIKRLKDTGWLMTRRTMGASIYGFSDQNINGLIDREIVLKEAREVRREARRALNTTDVHPSAHLKTTRCAPECTSDVHPSAHKHLSLTPINKQGLQDKAERVRVGLPLSGATICDGDRCAINGNVQSLKR